jgi:hypothetical protein
MTLCRRRWGIISCSLTGCISRIRGTEGHSRNSPTPYLCVIWRSVSSLWYEISDSDASEGSTKCWLCNDAYILFYDGSADLCRSTCMSTSWHDLTTAAQCRVLLQPSFRLLGPHNTWLTRVCAEMQYILQSIRLAGEPCGRQSKQYNVHLTPLRLRFGHQKLAETLYEVHTFGWVMMPHEGKTRTKTANRWRPSHSKPSQINDRRSNGWLSLEGHPEAIWLARCQKCLHGKGFQPSSSNLFTESSGGLEH